MRCPICDTTQTYTVGKAIKFGFPVRIYLCKTCQTFFCENHDEFHLLKKYYSQGQLKPSLRFYKMSAKLQKRWLLRQLDFTKIEDILEIGCGFGFLLYELRRMGKNVKGIEPDPGAAFYASRNLHLPIRNQMFEDCGEEGKFDLVILSHVLEHVAQPKNFLKKILQEYLKDNGYLFIEIPNSEFEIPYYQDEYYLEWTSSDHTFVYSKRSLEELAHRLKLRIVKCEDCTVWFYKQSMMLNVKIAYYTKLMLRNYSVKTIISTLIRCFIYGFLRWALTKIERKLLSRTGGVRCIMQKRF